VRDVTAMLVTRLAFDSTACLWVVSEYALAIGHPVDIAPAATPPAATPPVTAPPLVAPPVVAPPVVAPPVVAPPAAAPIPVAGAAAAAIPGRPADVEPTHMDPNVGAARYVPGRAGPVFPPGADDVSGSIRIPARRNYVPLVVAIVAVVAIIGTIGIVLALRDGDSCTGSACVTGSKQTPSTTAQPSTHVSSQASSPSVAPPAQGPSTLADVMPADLSVDDDCDSDGTPFLDHLSAYYACTESDESTMSGMSVWGYQFATKSAYRAGIAQFNTKVSFSAASAGTACPPTSNGDGSVTWHRNDNVDLALGHLECYYSGNHKNKDYAWTDDADFTIMVAEATPSETFAQLHTWWTRNNNNESE
jgi:hypothetical protein